MKDLRARIIKRVIDLLSKEDYNPKAALIARKDIEAIKRELPKYIPSEVEEIEKAVDNVVAEYGLGIRKIFSGFHGEIVLPGKASGSVVPYGVVYNKLEGGALRFVTGVFVDKETGRALNYYDIPEQFMAGRPLYIYLLYKNDKERYLIVFRNTRKAMVLETAVFAPAMTHFTGLGWKEEDVGEFIETYLTEVKRATKGRVIANAFYLDLCNFLIFNPYEAVIRERGGYYELVWGAPEMPKEMHIVKPLVDMNGRVLITPEEWRKVRGRIAGKATYDAL